MVVFWVKLAYQAIEMIFTDIDCLCLVTSVIFRLLGQIFSSEDVLVAVVNNLALAGLEARLVHQSSQPVHLDQELYV